jgi:hypothetical protein
MRSPSRTACLHPKSAVSEASRHGTRVSSRVCAHAPAFACAAARAAAAEAARSRRCAGVSSAAPSAVSVSRRPCPENGAAAGAGAAGGAGCCCAGAAASSLCSPGGGGRSNSGGGASSVTVCTCVGARTAVAKPPVGAAGPAAPAGAPADSRTRDGRAGGSENPWSSAKRRLAASLSPGASELPRQRKAWSATATPHASSTACASASSVASAGSDTASVSRPSVATRLRGHASVASARRSQRSARAPRAQLVLRPALPEAAQQVGHIDHQHLHRRRLR